MWIYEKKLQHPVKIAKCDPAMAKIIITQYEVYNICRNNVWQQIPQRTEAANRGTLL